MTSRSLRILCGCRKKEDITTKKQKLEDIVRTQEDGIFCSNRTSRIWRKEDIMTTSKSTRTMLAEAGRREV